MKLYKSIAFISVFTLSLSACLTPVATEYYVTPALLGQFIDSKTQQPIANVSVYLTDDYQTSSDSTGKFDLPPMIVFDSKTWDKDHFTQIYKYADVMVEGEGYQRRLFNIDGIALPTPTFDINTPVSINMGEIYLTPLAQSEHVYDRVYDYIKTMPYCQPSQSQKAVDCVPVPAERP